jgi:hypothetical protein
MLNVAFQRVPADKVARIRDWMAECARREDEVQATFKQEGMRAEKAWLIHNPDGSAIFVYAMDVEDIEASHAAARASKLPIDIEHQAVKREIDGGPLEVELIWDMVAKR